MTDEGAARLKAAGWKYDRHANGWSRLHDSRHFTGAEALAKLEKERAAQSMSAPDEADKK